MPHYSVPKNKSIRSDLRMLPAPEHTQSGLFDKLGLDTSVYIPVGDVLPSVEVGFNVKQILKVYMAIIWTYTTFTSR